MATVTGISAHKMENPCIQIDMILAEEEQQYIIKFAKHRWDTYVVKGPIGQRIQSMRKEEERGLIGMINAFILYSKIQAAALYDSEEFMNLYKNVELVTEYNYMFQLYLNDKGELKSADTILGEIPESSRNHVQISDEWVDISNEIRVKAYEVVSELLRGQI